jgi:hypothetical protein
LGRAKEGVERKKFSEDGGGDGIQGSQKRKVPRIVWCGRSLQGSSPLTDISSQRWTLVLARYLVVKPRSKITGGLTSKSRGNCWTDALKCMELTNSGAVDSTLVKPSGLEKKISGSTGGRIAVS